jgi:hypothetical protein
MATAGATTERSHRAAVAGSCWPYRDGADGAEGQLDQYAGTYC